MTHWQTTRFTVDLSEPRVMGIVNITPDSFSDGGRGTVEALRHAEQLLRDGAHVLDLGGESSRPGAAPVSEADELARVLPVLDEVVNWNVPISVDTYKPAVMREALLHGADIINDIQGLRRPESIRVVVDDGRCGLCVMHMAGDPATMQQSPAYEDVVAGVRAFLHERTEALVAAGVERPRVVIDPGIGFGKTVDHNFALLARQAELLSLGFPLLAGWSRKSSLGAVTGRAVGERVAASVAAALVSAARGARVLRVHDVAETVDALAVWRRAGAWGRA